MTDSFVITTPNPTATLGPDRTGQLAVTVTNLTGRQVRVRLAIVPTPPMDPGWVTFNGGGAEQPASLGATVQFGLHIAVPATVPPGTYLCRADAAAEDRPDDDSKEGPSLAIVVPQPPPPAPKPKWWLIPIAVLALLLVAGLVLWLFSRGDDVPPPPPPTQPPTSTAPAFTVPSVIGLPGPTAQNLLRTAGFTVTVTTSAASSCDPVVIAQNPAAGTVRTGQAGSVTITVERRRPFRLCVLDPGLTIGPRPPVLDR